MRFTDAILLGLAVRSGLAQSSVAVPNPVVPSSQVIVPGPSSAPAPVPTSAAAPVVSSQAPVQSSVAPVRSSNAAAAPTSAAVVPSSAAQPSGQSTQRASTSAGQATSGASVATSAGSVASSSAAGRTTVVSGSTVVVAPTTLVSSTTTGSRSSSGTQTSSSASATSTIADARSVPIQDSVLTENTKLTEVDGQPAVQMNAPANGQASCYINAEKPKDITETEKVKILASVQINIPTSKRSWWKRQSSGAGCDLSMTVDGTQAYSTNINKDTAASQGGKLDITSNAVQASSQKPKVEFSQNCRQEPVQVSVYQLTITGEKSNVQSPINPNQQNNNGGGNGNGGGDNNKDKQGAASSLVAGVWAAALIAPVAAFVL